MPAASRWPARRAIRCVPQNSPRCWPQVPAPALQAPDARAEPAEEDFASIRIDGVQLSIDDLGTGYACLAALLDVPFNELKLDRRFVGEALRDPDARRILHTTVALARELGMRCVAEGVEQRAIAESLQLKGCDAAQGWLWAPRWTNPPCSPG
ncbi:EAL domain-containing protein [Burkholderia gladioli]|uniref:EAL domain-containing protein n=1 Tax=Burkholderia gladioli TaxID=28095 RepID=UPI003EE3B30A